MNCEAQSSPWPSSGVGVFATLLFVAGMTLLGHGCAHHSEAEVVPQLARAVRPSICQQVRDTINAYIVYTGCEETPGEFGFFPEIGRRESRHGNCLPPNDLHHLPYSAPDIDDATFVVLQENLQRNRMLAKHMHAIWLASMPDLWTPGPFDEAEAGEVSDQLRELFWEVPFLSREVEKAVLDKVGAVAECTEPASKPAVRVSELPALLHIMENGRIRDDGSIWYGMFGFGGNDVPAVDPNVAVAISLSQRTGFGSVPSYQQVVASLTVMEVEILP